MMFEYKVFQGHISEIDRIINVAAQQGWRVHSFEPIFASVYESWFGCLMERIVQEHKKADVSETTVGAMAIKG